MSAAAQARRKGGGKAASYQFQPCTVLTRTFRLGTALICQRLESADDCGFAVAQCGKALPYRLTSLFQAAPPPFEA